MEIGNQDMGRALNGLWIALRLGARARTNGKAFSDCPFPEHSRIGRAWKIGYEAAVEATKESAA